MKWLRRLLDPPDRPLCEQMRSLWRVPPDWTPRPSWRVRVLRRGLAVVKKDAKRTA